MINKKNKTMKKLNPFVLSFYLGSLLTLLFEICQFCSAEASLS